MNKEMIFIIILVLLALLLIFSIIKKAVKLVLLTIIIIVGMSAVNIFVYGQSPAEELKAYKTNITYSKEVVSLTVKIKESASNIQSVIEKKELDQSAIDILKKENENLHSYQNQFMELQHTKRLDSFHNSYNEYLGTLVIVSDNAVKAENLGNKTIENAQELLNKMKGAIEKLISLK